MLAIDKIAAAFCSGDHASTFGGNPLAASVAGYVLDEVVSLLASVNGIIKKCMEKGLLLISSGEKVIRFVPPLITEIKYIDLMYDILSEVIENED